ncbi:MAG: MFS transporter [Bryobacteraceae bacterium]
MSHDGSTGAGNALGIFGLGNMGHSAAVFLGSVAAAYVGRDAVFFGTAALAATWAVVFFALARNAPRTTPPASLGPMLRVLMTERLSWALSAFYFLTFGGFVAFSIYLPSLLRDEFNLSMTDAGFRTAGFVVLATLLRPVGGILSDRIGGARVLSGVFLGVVPFALLLTWTSIVPFTVGALGCAAMLGLGNGAVFKLVPQLFPTSTATVTGLVGAMGGLGGFFPPLLLGFFRDRFGAVWPGFVLLAGCSLAMWALTEAVGIAAASRGAISSSASVARRRTHSRCRLGVDGDGAAGRRDCGWFARSPELRSRIGDLHLCGNLRHLGHCVPLRRMAEQATHPPRR